MLFAGLLKQWKSYKDIPLDLTFYISFVRDI